MIDLQAEVTNNQLWEICQDVQILANNLSTGANIYIYNI